MTTIAVDSTMIAADGQRLWGGEIRGTAFQKLKVRDSKIYAFTGLTPLFDHMVDWHLAGADPKELPVITDEGGWTLIVVDRHGVGKYSDACPYIERFEPPIAFGAGQDYAIGAMWAGASAQRAVELVSDNCNHTGGEIQVIRIADVVQGPMKVAAE